LSSTQRSVTDVAGREKISTEGEKGSEADPGLARPDLQRPPETEACFEWILQVAFFMDDSLRSRSHQPRRAVKGGLPSPDENRRVRPSFTAGLIPVKVVPAVSDLWNRVQLSLSQPTAVHFGEPLVVLDLILTFGMNCWESRGGAVIFHGPFICPVLEGAHTLGGSRPADPES